MTSQARATDRRLDPTAIVALAALAVLGALVGFALELEHDQTSQRRAAVTRFRDRAAVTSALVETIFSVNASSGDTAKQYGSGTVTDRELGTAAKRGRLSYAAVLASDGTAIAISPGLPPAAAKHLASRPANIEAVRRGTQFTVSDVLRTGPGGAPVIELVQALGGTEKRVAVSGVSPELLNIALGTYLAKVPLRDFSRAYIVDRHGVVVASRDGRNPVGSQLSEHGLAAAAARGTAGSIGGGRYFVSAPVAQTPFRVVLTTEQGKLFSAVSGARKWTPWAIFAAFALAAAFALVLLRRTLMTNRKLQEANAALAGRNQLLKEAAELARSNAELEQFASIASHDLQEPLRKVQTFAAQLNTTERERLSDEGQDYLRRMSDAAGRMRMLIDDLLMFSRVSTKGRPFEPVDLDEIAHQVVTDLEVSIAETGAHVRVDDLPTIDADPTQMRQLLQNLIANALKFSRPGVAPEVRVSAHTSNGTAEVSVSDNGIGFEPQYAGRIFRAFERLHSRDAYPGTGIGLALCRKIVERHHGTINATAEPDAGAVFTFVLPVEQSPGASRPAPEQVIHASA
jgi:signal transduction histidine kinase